jgi:hypothetical protein
MAPKGKPFCIFDFIWNELRRSMNDSRKSLPYAPYLMYMIERVTKCTSPRRSSMSHFIFVAVMIIGLHQGRRRPISMRAPLVKLLNMMMNHPLVLLLAVRAMIPWKRGFFAA